MREETGVSREELTHAYVRGGLSRRRFIKRLVAAGVTAGAAVSYANALAAPPPGTGRVGDHYDHYERPGRGCGDKNHTHEKGEDCGDKPRGPKTPAAQVQKGKDRTPAAQVQKGKDRTPAAQVQKGKDRSSAQKVITTSEARVEKRTAKKRKARRRLRRRKHKH
jgi:hypothetical protein